MKNADTVFKILRECCLLGIALETPSRKLLIKEIEPGEVTYFQNMSMIFLYGKSLNLVFKIHSMHSSMRCLAEIKYKKERGLVTGADIRDMTKELCNILSGSIQRIFRDISIDLSHSLPFCVEGFNELFFRNQTLADKDTYLITDREFCLGISVELESFDDKIPNLSESEVKKLVKIKKNAFEFF